MQNNKWFATKKRKNYYYFSLFFYCEIGVFPGYSVARDSFRPVTLFGGGGSDGPLKGGRRGRYKEEEET